MCGIFGSFDSVSFLDLFHENLSRGAYSGGILSIFENRIEIQKIRDLSKGPIFVSDKAMYHLGHVRAPTTKVSKFSGCHPFQYGSAIVAHNGILTNIKDLDDRYQLRGIEVDSEAIPIIYDYMNRIHSPTALQSTLQELEGTYGVWLYDVEQNRMLVGRGDNTIYWNKDQTTFSSKATKDINQLMPDGAIYSTVVDKDISVFFDINRNNRIYRKPKYFIPN